MGINTNLHSDINNSFYSVRANRFSHYVKIIYYPSIQGNTFIIVDIQIIWCREYGNE